MASKAGPKLVSREKEPQQQHSMEAAKIHNI